MTTVREASLTLKVDSTQGEVAVRRLRADMNDLTQTTGKTTGTIRGLVTALGGMALGYKGFQFVKDSIRLAAEAAETQNLFRVSLGESADEAEKWSRDVSRALGLNEMSVKRNIGVFNTMFDALGVGEEKALGMAQGLTQLTEDMASFYNLRPEVAFSKLRAGISGEVEPLKQLGIVLSETQIKNFALTQGWIEQGQELSEVGKVYARYALILRQTEKAQGDLARTNDSAANTQRRMQAQIDATKIALGESLLPAYQKTMSAISTYLQSNLDDVKAWGEGTADVLSWLVNRYASAQRSFADLAESAIGKGIIEKAAQERYRIETGDKPAFTNTMQGYGWGAHFETTPPRFPTAYKEILDKLTAEQNEVKQDRENTSLERRKLSGTYDLPTFDYNTVTPAPEEVRGLPGGRGGDGASEVTEYLAQMKLESELLRMTNQQRERKLALHELEQANLADIADGYGRSTEEMKNAKYELEMYFNAIDMARLDQFVSGVQDEIDAQQKLAKAMCGGREAYEQTVVYQQLLNRAMSDGVPITKDLRVKLRELAKQSQETADTLRTGGLDPNDFFGGFMDAMKGTKNELESLAEVGVEVGTQLRDGFAKSLTDAILDGKDFGESMKQVLRDIAREMMEYAIKMMVVKTMMAAFGGGAADGAVVDGGTFAAAKGAIFTDGAAAECGLHPFRSGSVTGFDKGGVISSTLQDALPSLDKFSGRMVDQPTYFKMRGGKFGLMGEAGPEGVEELERLPGGRYGVRRGDSVWPVTRDVYGKLAVRKPDEFTAGGTSGPIGIFPLVPDSTGRLNFRTVPFADGGILDNRAESPLREPARTAAPSGDSKQMSTMIGLLQQIKDKTTAFKVVNVPPESAKDYMTSRDGEQTLVNIMRRNRKALQ